MIIAERVIANALSLKHQQANRVTMALGTTSDFDRRIDVCHECGKEQKVTNRT